MRQKSTAKYADRRQDKERIRQLGGMLRMLLRRQERMMEIGCQKKEAKVWGDQGHNPEVVATGVIAYRLAPEQPAGPHLKPDRHTPRGNNRDTDAWGCAGGIPPATKIMGAGGGPMEIVGGKREPIPGHCAGSARKSMAGFAHPKRKGGTMIPATSTRSYTFPYGDDREET